MQIKNIIKAGLIALFFSLFLTACNQSVKTEAIHYPNYWTQQGYYIRDNVTMRVINGRDGEANEAIATIIGKYIEGKQIEAKHRKINVVEHDNPDLLLVIALRDAVKNVENSQTFHEEELVYEMDEHGFPKRDANGDKIPVWMTDKYGRHLYTDEGKPLYKTKKSSYTVIYREVGLDTEIVLFDMKSKQILDSFTSTRSYWSRGVNPESKETLFLKSIAKVADDIYTRVVPYEFVLDVSDENILRTAKNDPENSGKYDLTDEFSIFDQNGLVVLRLPGTADGNIFDVIVCKSGADINNPAERLVEKRLIWSSTDDHVLIEFSPSGFFNATGGSQKYDVNLIKDGSVLLKETFSIKAP